MPRPPIRLLAVAALLLLPAAASAQAPASEPAQAPAAQAAPAPAGDAGQAERSGLTSPEVEETVDDQPTPQGTRPPEDDTVENTPSLYEALAAVRQAPPMFDARRRVPRPNRLASEPAKEMTPIGGPEHLFPEGYVE